MRKAWHVVSLLAMTCILLGVAGAAVGFFTGSSPSAIASHGHIQQYGERLAMNWDILKQDFAAILAAVRSWLANIL